MVGEEGSESKLDSRDDTVTGFEPTGRGIDQSYPIVNVPELQLVNGDRGGRRCFGPAVRTGSFYKR